MYNLQSLMYISITIHVSEWFADNHDPWNLHHCTCEDSSLYSSFCAKNRSSIVGTLLASSYGSCLLTGIEKTEEQLQFSLQRAQAHRALTVPSSWHRSELQISESTARLLGKLLPLRQSSHDQASYWQWSLAGVNSWTMPWQCLGELQTARAKALQGLGTV